MYVNLPKKNDHKTRNKRFLLFQGKATMSSLNMSSNLQKTILGGLLATRTSSIAKEVK